MCDAPTEAGLDAWQMLLSIQQCIHVPSGLKGCKGKTITGQKEVGWKLKQKYFSPSLICATSQSRGETQYVLVKRVGERKGTLTG
jgi:hypothetical protein